MDTRRKKKAVVAALPQKDASGLRFWSNIFGRGPQNLWSNSVRTKPSRRHPRQETHIQRKTKRKEDEI